MNRAVTITKGGAITGLCILFLYFSSFTVTGRIGLIACTGFLMMIALIETSTKGALATYCAISLLAFFLLPVKWIAVMFFLFFGIYPILKKKIEGMNHKNIIIVLKLCFYNADAALIYYIFSKILGIDIPWPIWLVVIGILASNILFFMYDYLLAVLFDQYLRRIYRYKGQG